MSSDGAGGANSSVQKFEDLDLGAIAIRTAKSVVKNRPISISVWVLGLLLAAFANGFSVDDTTRESYMATLDIAADVDKQGLSKALQNLDRAQDKYYQAKGWFWSCDNRCQKALDKVNMAKAEVMHLQQKRDAIVKEARKEVGIWSTFGVQDVRNAFWTAWKNGKSWAARYTMMDALFLAVGGKEETMVSYFVKLAMQYIINLTLGLMGAFCFFIYNVYTLIVSYGEPMLSGLAFFLLVLVAGVATVGSYLFAIYGTVAGGGLYLAQQAAKQAAVEGGRPGGPRRQVGYNQYGGARAGFRTHMD